MNRPRSSRQLAAFILFILLGAPALLGGISACSDDSPSPTEPGDRDDEWRAKYCPEILDSLERSRQEWGAPGLCEDCEGSGAEPGVDPAAECAFEAEEGGCFPRFEPARNSIADIQGLILAGEMSCEEIVEGYLERIARYDLDISQGAPINAFEMFNEQVRAQARALDQEFSRTGELAGSLHCAPIAIKANFDSTDTLTTSGSKALRAQASRDGFALQMMREQGAILVGTTTMDEFAQGVQGIGGGHGKSGNAFNTAMNSGGSSAGSGAAVAAGFVLGATGTDNCGSLTVPAAYHGLATLRPTLGLVSLDGVFPSGRLDGTAGPIAKSVEDLATFLDVMAQHNPEDPRHQDPAWRRPDSYAAELGLQALEGKRIGVLRRLSSSTEDAYREPFVGGTAQVDQVWARALADLERLGAEVVENIHLPEFESTRYSGGWVVDVDKYLSQVDSPTQDFEALCREDDFSHFVFSGPGACLSSVRSGTKNPTGSLEKGQRKYAWNRAHIEEVMDCLGLDALVYPADALGAAQPYNSKTNCVASATSELPTVVVSAGFTQDEKPLPVGVMLMGRRFDEARLLAMAYAYEQGTHWREPPALRSGADPEQIPPVDLAAQNAVRRALGRAALEEVLREGNKYDLNAQNFRQITREVLEEAGLDYLVAP